MLVEENMNVPLADRMRPASVSEFAGQEHLLGDDRPIGRMIAARHAHSMVLWGQPCKRKTTVARRVARASDARWGRFSAVHAGGK